MVANQYKTNREQFNQAAKEWTAQYANKQRYESKVKNLMEMGFEEKKVRAAL